MASLNKVILIGHVVADPELKNTQTGVEVCSFRIGVSRRFKEQDGTYKSDFFDIVAWRKTAVFVTTYFKKGKPICIYGSLQQRSWETQDGAKRYAVEVVADEVSFVEKMDNTTGYSVPAQSETGNPAPPASGFVDISNDDDLPF